MNKIDFGYKEIFSISKKKKVKRVFDSVAQKYDLMNDVMSLGVHRLWKKKLLPFFEIGENNIILDLAGGTGDITKLLSTYVVQKKGFIVLCDINFNMIKVAKDNLEIKKKNVFFVQMDAENLLFLDNTFDCVVISFGLRNVSNKLLALKNINRVLKVGGKLIILEFSKPNNYFFKMFYDYYSFKLLPKFGKHICGDEDSYKYLVESIRLHPNQNSLNKLILSSGFFNTQFVNFTNGIVSMHISYKK